MSDIQQDAPEDSRPVQQSAECQKAEDTENELRGNLVDDLREVQEAIEQHKIDLTGVPEALRSEAEQLRDELSQMELFSRLGELKEQLASASEAAESAPTRGTNADGTSTETTGQEVNVQATAALVCEAEDTELDIQLQQLLQAVEVAKQSKMNLETEKMRLQKEMLEFQLLLNAEDQEGACCGLDDAEEDDARCQSPRIPAVKDFQLVELESTTDSEQAAVQ